MSKRIAFINNPLCVAIGTPDKLPEDVLPSKCDALRYYMFLRTNEARTESSTLYNQIYDDMYGVWKHASITPTRSRLAVIKELKKLENQRKLINKKKNIDRINEFKIQLSGILNMVKHDKDVPRSEWKFYRDQCGPRKCRITSST